MSHGTRWTLVLMAGLGLASGAAWAGHHEQGERHGKDHRKAHGTRFEKMDTNEDGELSRDEWLAASKSRFEKMDADGNGSLTREEMRAGHARRGPVEQREE